MTAVIRCADASFAASIMMRSSIRWSFTGGEHDCTMKTSAPRIDSRYRQYVSPLANVLSSTSPSWMPSCSAIFAARSGFERPEKSMSFPDGPRSIHRRSPAGWTGSTVSSPGIGRASSVVSVSTTVAFLVDLLGSRDGERSWRNVLRDRRSRSDPSMVANLHRCNKDIVAAGVDIAPNHGSLLLVVLLGTVVGGDGAGADVGALADLGVADVREVGHLDALAQGGVLHLHERSHLRPCSEHGPRPEVRERSDSRVGPDLRVDDDCVRPDLRA